VKTFFDILLYSLLVFAIVLLLGQILQIIYIIFTPSSNLSTEDCKRKNYWEKLFKKD